MARTFFPIMLALCSMLPGTYYAHNYASIISGSLASVIIISTLHWQALKV